MPFKYVAGTVMPHAVLKHHRGHRKNSSDRYLDKVIISGFIGMFFIL